MSQKVHPKGFRLRSTGKLSLLPHSSTLPTEGTWDSIWFSEPKKGKHLYTRILHEDQVIQEYTKGFFRSFGFYQQKCVIERKCNKELHITSYVLRTPKLQPSKFDIMGTRTRQEKVLQEGLQKGWIPYLIKSVISKILYDKSLINGKFGLLCPTNFGYKKSNQINEGSSGSKGTLLSNSNSTLFPSLAPSILPVLSPQENSIVSVHTNKKRFYDFWNSWLITKQKHESLDQSQNVYFSEAVPHTGHQGKGTEDLNAARSELKVLKKGYTLNNHMTTPSNWWIHRSWSSILYFPSEYCYTPLVEHEQKKVLSDATSTDHQGILTGVRIIYSIRPAQSLTVSSQLIVDYIADKIEQSTPVGLIFNELLRFFETEASCLGPAFLKESSNEVESRSDLNAARSEPLEQHETQNNNRNESSERPKILGFRIICSGRLQMSSFSKPAEKAESIELTRGVLPLNTFKANIDFAQTHATNAYGTCGIKVWVNRG